MMSRYQLIRGYYVYYLPIEVHFDVRAASLPRSFHTTYTDQSLSNSSFVLSYDT